MSRPEEDPPAPAAVAGYFEVTAVERDGETVRYLGDSLVPPATLTDELRDRFRDRGYTIDVNRREPSGPALTPGVPAGASRSRGSAPYELVAEPVDAAESDGVPWLNVGLLLATVASTLYVGASRWYYIPVFESPWRVFEAWPFVVAMLGVLGIHELGHYAAARYHGVEVTLPYFIPFPSLLGTMGAVINIRGRIPSRRVLFDIGVAGPLAGLVATVVVTVVGLSLDPIAVPQQVTESASAYAIRFHDPLLLQGLEWLVTALGLYTRPEAGTAVHPIVFAGWAGMFFTFLNLLPVGQLDGGHLVRAIVGRRQETVAAAVPGALFALAGFLYLTRDPPPVGYGVWTLWAFWGLFALGLAYAGPATPTVDEPLDRRRTLLGLVTFALGLACFTPIPFEIVSA